MIGVVDIALREMAVPGKRLAFRSIEGSGGNGSVKEQG